jgi:putative molybdopterin biosynthesis protein
VKQGQFLKVVTDEEAHRILDEAFAHLGPESEEVALEHALGRVLAAALRSPVDVPGFDRSNMDGFAIQAADSYGATETEPKRLRVRRSDAIAAGRVGVDGIGQLELGQAIEIATGGVVPRGADAVLMVEDSAPLDGADEIHVFRALTPGTNISGAGSDVGRGEIVLQAGQRMTSRETALAAAVGAALVSVTRRPRALVLSTGDEVRAPGEQLGLGQVFDSNSRILIDALTEAGADASFGGILPDDEDALHAVLAGALDSDEAPDLILLSGGTSKGRGDLNSSVLKRLTRERSGSRGIIVHGVALKPGKPICVAEIDDRPIAVLPGFPTSAIFTFHEFIAPLVRRLTGEVGARGANSKDCVRATMPHRVRSIPGRTEYVLVDLATGDNGLSAYPLGAGSGSVSTFSRADGYLRVPRHCEYIEEGEQVEVHPIGGRAVPADLLAIGSHCVGLELILGRMAQLGFRCKSVPVGSKAGLRALERGEGDVAGCHLLDEVSGQYNRAFLPAGTEIIGGYGRRQGIVFRPGDERFAGFDLDAMTAMLRSQGARMVNRNRGSGTRQLLDQLLKSSRPPGHSTEAKSHHAVAAAVAQGRADWGMTLDVLARDQGLGFVFVRSEHFELVTPTARRERPALKALVKLMDSAELRAELVDLGFESLT